MTKLLGGGVSKTHVRRETCKISTTCQRKKKNDKNILKIGMHTLTCKLYICSFIWA